MPADTRPRLRLTLRARPVEIEGNTMVALEDPDAFAEETAVLPPALLPLLELFDGKRSLREMQELFLREGAGMLPLDAMDGVVSALDRCYLLDNERFREARAAREREFLSLKVRPAAHAGTAYPADREAARAFLDGLFHAAGEGERESGSLRRLIAPHIDLRLGAGVHGAAARELADAGRPDFVVVLGVAHEHASARFVGCRMDFETPFGPVRHDPEFLNELESRSGASLDEGVLIHRREHSVEFQALWLAYLWPEDPPPIVPILVTSFHDLIAEGKSPSQDERVEAFVGGLRAALQEREQRGLVIASVDLAHLGPLYDQPEGLDEAGERVMEAADRALLEPVLAGDAEGFFRAAAEGENARNVCGVAPIYVALRLGTGPGTLIRYGQGRIDPSSGSVVSFAAVGYPA